MIYTEKGIQRSSFVFSICLFVYYFLFLFGFNGDRDRSQIKFAGSGIFILLKFTTVSRCILGNERCENLEHRQRGGESILRKACDTCASTSR